MNTRMQFLIVNRHIAELRDEAAQARLARAARISRVVRIADRRSLRHQESDDVARAAA